MNNAKVTCESSDALAVMVFRPAGTKVMIAFANSFVIFTLRFVSVETCLYHWCSELQIDPGHPNILNSTMYLLFLYYNFISNIKNL